MCRDYVTTPTCFSSVYCLFLHPHQHQVEQRLGFYLVLYNYLHHRMSDSTFTTKQMELLNFEVETLTNDGGILRRIKVKGDGFSNPNEGANVHGKKKEKFVQIIIDLWMVWQQRATFSWFCCHSAPGGNLQRQTVWLQGCQFCRGRGWRQRCPLRRGSSHGQDAERRVLPALPKTKVSHWTKASKCKLLLLNDASL